MLVWCSVLFGSSWRLCLLSRGVTVGRCGCGWSPGLCLALLHLSNMLHPCHKGDLKPTGVVCEVSAGDLQVGHLCLEVTQVSSRVHRECPDLLL